MCAYKIIGVETMSLGKLIGKGHTASVYEWEESKVLKLFNQGYSDEAIIKEYHNALAINHMKFSKPKAYKIISFKNKQGILYDKVNGEILTNWSLKTSDVQNCAIYMANLHKAILQNKTTNVPNYKDFLINQIPAHYTYRKNLIQAINKLPDGNTLCHGDFHPGNIIISGEDTYAIDFMNMCHGNYLYDIARTVFLVEYTPIPNTTKDKNMILHFKRTLTDLYLSEMNVSREMIKDYLSIIISIRKWECPNEITTDLNNQIL